jgi:CDP-4-dehydro-6-deoxyglucose reductase, E1
VIPLMKSAFFREQETKQALAQFIIASPRLSMDVKCREFEREFSKFQGQNESILVNSGASANLAILQALLNLGRIRRGDKVGFSAITWSTNVMPIIQLGLIPVAVDCDPTTLNVMSSNLLNCLETAKLKALFITNALGFAGDLDKIKEVCAHENIVLLEDNCESLGTQLPSGMTGNFGIASTFSFFVAHHMSTIEGGMICTSDLELAEMVRIVRANGWDRNLTAAQQIKWRKSAGGVSEFEAKYTFYDLGFNIRPTEITGFLGLYQMKFLLENIKRREENYTFFEKFIRENSDLVLLKRSHISVLSNFAVPIICKTQKMKEHYLSEFSGAGVEVRPMIAGNMQKQPFYKKYVAESRSLPGADAIHDCGFYFGNYMELSDIDLETLSSCLIK